MPPAVATALCSLVVLGLFWLDRDQKARTSIALWLPVIWVGLACSRSVSQWLWMESAQSVEQVLEGDPVDRLVYTALLAAGLIVLISRKQRVVRVLQANGPILLFFFYCVTSLLWSDYPDVAFKRWIKALGDFVMLLVVLTDREPSAAFKRLLARVSYVLIPFSIVFIKYYPELGTGYSPWGGPPTYTGVTTNKNTLGVICLCFGLGALWRFLALYKDREVSGRTRQLIAQGALLAMALWLFRTANSMTSLSCFLMASILLVTTTFWASMRRPAVLHLVIAAMLAASVSVLFLGIGQGVLETMGRNPTLTDRTEVWALLRSLVQNPLLGTGFESFWVGPRLVKLWSVYWWHPNEAHNGYLEIFLNLGWAGLVLLALVLVTGYRTVVSAYRRNLPMGNLRLALFVVGIAYNFTEAAFFKMLAPAWIFFLLAIVSVPAVAYRKLQPTPQSLSEHHAPLTHEHAPSTLSEEIV